ncbi:hypothetical protein VTL71DRAFT_3359 [Oculimacula yallundae]|uniref:Uncharacterized protein n=1 Tax=Oculimacula yallundae TaxID=86028 RepID=A0ABR4C8U8_9HELO
MSGKRKVLAQHRNRNRSTAQNRQSDASPFRSDADSAAGLSSKFENLRNHQIRSREYGIQREDNSLRVQVAMRGLWLSGEIWGKAAKKSSQFGPGQ